MKIKYYIDDKGFSCAEFNDMKFIKEDSGYYKISDNWNENIPNSYRLHKAVYEYYNGKVKKGNVVHHKDLDKGNNEESNLEELTQKEHNRYHQSLMTNKQIEIRDNNWKKANKAAVDWHKNNPLSNVIHSMAAKKGWAKRKPYKHICKQCGDEFESLEKESNFCCGKCKNDYHLGYSLLEIESIEYIGKHDVYNMEVSKHHNYAIDGGMIIHNCDAIRYYVSTILKTRILRLK